MNVFVFLYFGVCLFVIIAAAGGGNGGGSSIVEVLEPNKNVVLYLSFNEKKAAVHEHRFMRISYHFCMHVCVCE